MKRNKIWDLSSEEKEKKNYCGLAAVMSKFFYEVK